MTREKELEAADCSTEKIQFYLSKEGGAGISLVRNF